MLVYAYTHSAEDLLLFCLCIFLFSFTQFTYCLQFRLRYLNETARLAANGFIRTYSADKKITLTSRATFQGGWGAAWRGGRVGWLICFITSVLHISASGHSSSSTTKKTPSAVACDVEPTSGGVLFNWNSRKFHHKIEVSNIYIRVVHKVCLKPQYELFNWHYVLFRGMQRVRFHVEHIHDYNEINSSLRDSYFFLRWGCA